MLKGFAAAALALISYSIATLAPAQSYPAKVVRIIVPYPPGGPNDLLARIVAQALTERWGRQVIVDNRPGGSTTVGVSAVAAAAPDGYTLLVGSAGSMTIKASVFQKLPYDIIKDFAPISTIASGPFVMVLHPSLPAQTVRQFVELAKARPAEMFFGSPGSGSGGHLSGELLKLLAKIDIVHVPYRGGGPAMTDLLSGQISILFSDITTAEPHLKTGRLKALAVTSATRSRVAPNLPTIAEGGVPGYEVSTWYGLFAPTDTPREIVGRLSSELETIMRSDALISRLALLGADPSTQTPEQFADFVKRDFAKWSTVVKAANVKME
ncbi:MAG: tripartite tricarboxylate transporter substrate binding protein [Betaproteobacteria bacterium]|nr:tripartite tricarboxylate transporter substrate binding protein [Betaproteobacteria bacterium]